MTGLCLPKPMVAMLYAHRAALAGKSVVWFDPAAPLRSEGYRSGKTVQVVTGPLGTGPAPAPPALARPAPTVALPSLADAATRPRPKDLP